MLFQGQEFMEVGSFNDWEAVDWKRAEHYSGIISAYKDLISLRKNSKNISLGLTGGSINIIHQDENNKVIAYHRWAQGGPKDDTIVIINFGDRFHENYSMSFPRTGTWKVRFNSTSKSYSDDFEDVYVPDIDHVDTGGGNLVLPPSSAIVLSQDN